MSHCHKLRFFNTCIFATQCRRPQIFQTMNYVRSNNLSLKYQRFTPSGCKDTGIGKFEFVAKTQFLSRKYDFKFFYIFVEPLLQWNTLSIVYYSLVLYLINFTALFGPISISISISVCPRINLTNVVETCSCL